MCYDLIIKRFTSIMLVSPHKNEEEAVNMLCSAKPATLHGYLTFCFRLENCEKKVYSLPLPSFCITFIMQVFSVLTLLGSVWTHALCHVLIFVYCFATLWRCLLFFCLDCHVCSCWSEPCASPKSCRHSSVVSGSSLVSSSALLHFSFAVSRLYLIYIIMISHRLCKA